MNRSQARLVHLADQPTLTGSQGQIITPVIHTGVVPVIGLAVGVVNMPPSHVARAHVHRYTDLVVYVVSGRAATLWGNEMEVIRHDAGGMVWIPAGVPHTAVNLSSVDPVLAVEARTDPTFNADVELLPELESVVRARVRELLT